MGRLRAWLPIAILWGFLWVPHAAWGGYKDGAAARWERPWRVVTSLPAGAVLAKRHAGNAGGLGPGNDGLDWQKRYREWQSLSPEEKEKIRKRYEKYKSLPEPKRKLYEKRYRQWERLTPAQKKRVEDGLRRWDQLTPQEQESIRRLFLR
ncbi:Protein of unknown function [Desulfacinum hydrothermale DSM 13146]|uniref:DUF3106 domain-containing protein n=1 Tax=Desulfacinum hydrothermale DSM 13146 TaxID=1121390 RepID=A0A1W1XG61_9BACT|nr:DUF3106 domain-containing protein [Desulfacinum hydrothermale]SMC22939.1 Protein of unknown function [Desulfacinum hydrothermale DSM 13146]